MWTFGPFYGCCLQCCLQNFYIVNIFLVCMEKKVVWTVVAAVVVLVAAFGFYFDSPEGEVVDVSGFGEVMDYGYTDVSVAEAKVLMEADDELKIVDVSPYYEDGHIPGAVWYEVGDGTLDFVIDGLDKNATYLVYCHADGPSILASKKLIDAGVVNVYRLKGNFAAWVEAGELVIF